MSPETSRPPTSRARRALFIFVSLLLVYGVLELLAWGIYRATFAGGHSFAGVAAQKERTRRGSRGEHERRAGGEFHDSRVFHPYLGHVNRPLSPVSFDSRVPVAELFDETCRSNIHGLFGADDLATPEGSVEVVILGGSVANLLYCYSRSVIEQALASIPAFQGKPIVFSSAALCGYKQPQQLLALSYLMVHGKRPDVVINVDGFNEVVGNDFREGFPQDQLQYPLYPELWSEAFSVHGGEELRAIGGIQHARQRRAEWAEAARSVGFSVLGNLVWALFDRHLLAQENEARVLLQGRRRAEGKRPFARFGPRMHFNTFEDYADFSARAWYNASLQLHRLARAGGFAYFHFLQPSIHVPGAKTLTPREVDFVRTGRPMGEKVRRGYPVLKAHGERLRQQGVAFHDLNSVFQGTSETVAADNCCHFNREGDRLIAEAIGRIVRAGLEAAPAGAEAPAVR